MLGRVIESLVYDVSVTDAATYGVILAVSLCASFLASYLPAMRAAQVDPVRALRQE